ncbi:MAG: hypothetical protein V2J02_08340 [Pseudomonadales bacterium]|nr:hypothetical protein [Pseudomonadales bacterium]
MSAFDQHSGIARIHDGAAGELDGDPLVLVPPGEYELVFKGWRTLLLFNRQPKVKVDFTILDPGPYQGLLLTRWYNARSLVGKPRNRGRFKHSRSSDILREFCAVVGRPVRYDRLPLSVLSGRVVVGQVATVEKDRNQQSIPDGATYSTIRRLIRSG